MANNNLKLQIFPKKLDSIRYIEFSFYKADLVEDIIKTLENSVTTASKTLVNNPTEESIKIAIKSVKDELIKTGSKTFKTIRDEANSRINTGRLNSSEINMNRKTWISNIILPLPNNLEENLNHEWQEENGPVASILNNGIGSDSLASRVVNGLAALTGTRNVTVNPDYVQMYKGSKPREVSFSWTLMPNSKEEAETI